MIQNTLFIFGPGGIGKSPLDDIIRSKKDVLRIDPYRLRHEGPRDKGEGDLFYANPKLQSELLWIFKALGDEEKTLSEKPVVKWFPKARTAFFDVRGEWQCLLLGPLGPLDQKLAKAEVYGPAAPALFSRKDIKELFGNLSIVILNPVASLTCLNGDYESLKKATNDNCSKAKRSEKAIKKRVESIDDPEASEVIAWLAMLELGGLEYANWPFPEYVYKHNRIQTLIDARRTLVTKAPALKLFFKSEDEIRLGGADA